MKTVDFSETIEPVTLKLVDAENLLSVLRFVSIEGQCHFLTLAKGHLHMKIKTCFPQKPLGHFNQILYVSF